MSQIEIVYLTEDPTLLDICQRYWTQADDGQYVEKATAIAVELGVTQNALTKMLSTSCYAVSRQAICKRCQQPMRMFTRAQWQERSTWRGWSCPDCRDIELVETEVISRARQEERQAAQRAALRRDYPFLDSPPIDVDALSFRTTAYLLSFLHSMSTTDSVSFGPATSAPLAPTDDLKSSILVELGQHGLIGIHADKTPFDAFVFDGPRVDAYYPTKAIWYLPSASGERVWRLARRLDESLQVDPWPDEWWDEADDLLHTLALHECLDYFSAALQHYDIEFNPKDKSRENIVHALGLYSIGQVCQHIHSAVRNAAADLAAHKQTRGTAGSSASARIRYYADNALAKGWDIPSRQRFNNAEQSALSKVLLGTVLKIDDAAEWNRRPNQRQTES
ncbi:MAG: hypothetical protein HY855_17760 [Burkholderiales bacterium]|nr:hypothetical protein [Burkholderiales bacterium]